MSRWRQRVQRFMRWNQTLADLRERINDTTRRTNLVQDRLEVFLREHRILHRQLTLPPLSLWKDGPAVAATAPAGSGTPRSTVCRQDLFETPAFAEWTRRLGLPLRYHRKQWEFAFIGQALQEHGMLRRGTRGVGFGVGGEPLTACFASFGCHIVATDMAFDEAVAAGWRETNEHAAGRDALRRPEICSGPDFDANVTFQLCDMNAVDASLTGFDFCWSACALEHLGTIEKGLRFIERSVECLAPGGIAVHTTEFNAMSNSDTLTQGPAVLFRRRDMEELSARIAARGWWLAPFDFDTGDRPIDRYIDLPPYLDQPHLKLAVEGYTTTSIGLILRKPS